MSVEQLKLVIDFFELRRDLNERHVERVRKLEFDYAQSGLAPVRSRGTGALA